MSDTVYEVLGIRSTKVNGNQLIGDVSYSSLISEFGLTASTSTKFSLRHYGEIYLLVLFLDERSIMDVKHTPTCDLRCECVSIELSSNDDMRRVPE